jgi:hypothetical protein
MVKIVGSFRVGTVWNSFFHYFLCNDSDTLRFCEVRQFQSLIYFPDYCFVFLYFVRNAITFTNNNFFNIFNVFVFLLIDGSGNSE